MCIKSTNCEYTIASGIYTLTFDLAPSKPVPGHDQYSPQREWVGSVVGAETLSATVLWRVQDRVRIIGIFCTQNVAAVGLITESQRMVFELNSSGVGKEEEWERR